jgi:hypothetical protein
LFDARTDAERRVNRSEHQGIETGLNVLVEGGQLGEEASQEVVELIDGLGLLLDLGLQPAGDFAQEEYGVRWRGRRGGDRGALATCRSWGCPGVTPFPDDAA